MTSQVHTNSLFRLLIKCSVIGSVCLSALSVYAQDVTFSGYVWVDANENGIQDSELPFAGGDDYPVKIIKNSDNTEVLATTITNGLYAFPPVPSADGPYRVEIILDVDATYFFSPKDQGGNDSVDSDFNADGISDAYNADTVLDCGLISYRAELSLTKIAADPGNSRVAPDGSVLYVTNSTWVEYTYYVTNTGNLTLYNLQLFDDPHFPEFDAQFNEFSVYFYNLPDCVKVFEPGDSFAFVTNIQISASVTNVATISGSAKEFKDCAPITRITRPSDTDDAVVTVVNLQVDKSVVDPVGVPDANGYFDVKYRIAVTNLGDSDTSYDVIDTPDFDGGIDVLAASVTGHVAAAFSGAGPYTVAVDQVISPGGFHEYWITVSNRLSAGVMFGTETVSQCIETNENQFAPGSGLFNESIIYYGGPSRHYTDRSHTCTNVTIPGPVSIGDTVWYDKDGNGLPDEDLSVFGLTNVQVRLTQIVGSYVNITTNTTYTSGANRGYYEFNPLPFGYFVVGLIKSTVPVGFHIPTTPLAYTNQLGAFVGGVITNDDFGLNNEYLTPIELESLSARVDGDAVVVEWVTSWESETLGYHIYRSATGSEADRVRVSGGLIPGAGGANGHAYAWMDETVESGHVYHYWLVEEATNGDLAWYGPVAVSLDNVDSGRDLARYSLPAGGDALVRVSYETLLEAGLPVSQLDAGQLQVFVDGSEVARFVSSPGDTLQAGDFVLFHVGASDSAQHVSIRVSDSDPALAPSWIYARPRRGAGDVRVIDSAGAGQLAFEHEGGPVRTVLTGFNVPSVWLFDVTDPERSGLIYGYATVAGDNDSFALYLSLPVDSDMRGLAVEDNNVIDLKDVDRE